MPQEVVMADSLRRVHPVSPHFVGVREAPRQDEHSKRRHGRHRRGPDIEADKVEEEERDVDAPTKRIDVRI
jgi:hypothetical protein